mmetsp:Transcript_63333/g.173931  ORF Transcript_63333/g.173931 Transcript_63333/m.173931 type:complete len:97 (-) Transcript_63333:295-585(-)
MALAELAAQCLPTADRGWPGSLRGRSTGGDQLCRPPLEQPVPGLLADEKLLEMGCSGGGRRPNGSSSEVVDADEECIGAMRLRGAPTAAAASTGLT